MKNVRDEQMERVEKRVWVGVWGVMSVVALAAIVSGAEWHWLTLAMSVGMGIVTWFND